MKFRKIVKVLAMLCMGMMLAGCVSEKVPEEISDTNIDIQEPEVEEDTYIQNDAYKMFYGTWEITGIVSEHTRLGGDDGYEDVLGMQIVYTPDEYKNNGICISDPDYLMSIFPIGDYCPFLNTQEQVGVKTLLPEQDYFMWVQIVNKPILNESDIDEQESVSLKELYVGNEFFIKDDSTMYCFDYNCIYEMTRVSYIDDYVEENEVSYHERW